MACMTIVLVTVATLMVSRCNGHMPGLSRSDIDRHGGVQMGIPMDDCDNGQDHLAIDWDPSVPGSDVEYTCTDLYTWPSYVSPPETYCSHKEDMPYHRCMDVEIEYDETPPLSGAHRPLWPVYGEYLYVPPQRWLHSLEHGAAVFLYHPCANPEQIDMLRNVATSCLWKHVITPYRHLHENKPFAILTYMCKLTMSEVDVGAAEDFIREHALSSPEAGNTEDGQYRVGLLEQANIVSDEEDSDLCPDYRKVDAGVPWLREEDEGDGGYFQFL